MAENASIVLTDEQDAYVSSLVASGRYESVSAVLQRGLEMLRQDAEAHDSRIAALRALIGQRMEEPSEQGVIPEPFSSLSSLFRPARHPLVEVLLRKPRPCLGANRAVVVQLCDHLE